MAGPADNEAHQTIIIKRIKKGGGGHHGGAWKVAYADFVTAMMAFFLLLWLLSTTTPEQREGIAEYFTPTVGLKDSKGIGFDGGLTPNEKGKSRSTMTDPGLVVGQVKQGPTPGEPKEKEAPPQSEQVAGGVLPAPEDASQAEAETPPEDAAIAQAKEEMEKVIEEDPQLQQLQKNILITNTPEGLRIDVVDDPEKPIFLENTATMTDIGRVIFKATSGVITRTQNQIAVAGHTEVKAYPPGATYTGWELSADRANATRRFLAENLLEPRRVARVTGLADKELLLPSEPQSARNRRIAITLLRNAQAVSDPGPAGRDLLSIPKVDAKQIEEKREEPPAPPPPPSAPAAPAPKDSIFTPGTGKPVGGAPSGPGNAQAGRDLISVPTVDTTKVQEKQAAAPPAAPSPAQEGGSIFAP